ncbi:sensor histidine kinase [Streptomyces sp. NPDC048416]|uniref:sensor histidine kinase n=1 Tax=Streptomyces sp. NPDC048416 TaxID=3365546 RepID=UPI003720191D
MLRGLRPLVRGSTYAGVLFALGGPLASLVPLPFAMVPVLVWPSGPYGVRTALALLVWGALIGALGLARTTRRVLIVSARRLLRVPLPDPVAPRRPTSSPRTGPATDRWRTSLWLLLHVAAGWTGTLVGGVLVIAGLTLPWGWFEAEAGLSLFGWTVRADGGWVSWALALGCLLLAATLCVGVTYVLRRLAPGLLGPSTAERLALAAERELRLAESNRLAHELHDSIGHTLTATTIQAAVAGELLLADPAAARGALRSIEESARTALEDLDYVLGVLRAENATTAPTRTLADLPELLERLRHGGAVVEPELSGDLARVRATLSRAAYRIVQEGLTNALRHGAAGPVQVRVTAARTVLELSVVNETRTAPGPNPFPTSGHGLAGLAERVRLLHGTIETGPDGPRHWRLAVRLPLRPAA